MEKSKVLICIEGGLLSYTSSDSDNVEIVVIDKDDDAGTPARLRFEKPDFVETPKGFKKRVNLEWADILSFYIGQEVDVEADGQNLHNDFRGTLEKVIEEENGYFYARTRDQDDNYFDVDVINVRPAEEE
jgi:hypothetical protein